MIRLNRESAERGRSVAIIGADTRPCPTMTLAEHEFRIEKVRLALSVRLLGGDVLAGHVFVQPPVYGATTATALDLLNQGEAYFPLACDDRGILLVAKERLVEAWGEAVGEEDETRVLSSRAVGVELRLASGVTANGTMLLEVPSGRPRLLDFLNDCRMRFLRLMTTEGPRIINARLIESARPLD